MVEAWLLFELLWCCGFGSHESGQNKVLKFLVPIGHHMRCVGLLCNLGHLTLDGFLVQLASLVCI